MVIEMKMYLDLIVLLNFFLDFILLFSVSMILKRNTSLKRIALGALIGGVSVLSLFINFNSITLFLFKVVMSIIMVLVTFSFKSLKFTFNNLVYLYLVSIILGGFLYWINDELAYKNTGLVFFHSGFSINWLLIIICAPVILTIYVVKTRRLKAEYAKRYEVEITFLNGKKTCVTGFLDTGNNLVDPYKKRPIIMINKALLGDYKPSVILVPCVTVNKESLINCFKIKKLLINREVVEEDVLVGISDNNFGIEGVDCLLHKRIVKEMQDENDN